LSPRAAGGRGTVPGYDDAEHVHEDEEEDEHEDDLDCLPTRPLELERTLRTFSR
jgi:hypothetical protein